MRKIKSDKLYTWEKEIVLFVIESMPSCFQINSDNGKYKI